MNIPEYPHFTVVEAGPGVYAALAGYTGACISNTGIIDLGDRTLIFDTFQTVQAAEDLRKASMALTGRSAALVVISHWHPDHTGGAQVFDDVPIKATQRTVELIAGEDPGDLDAYSAEIDEWLDQIREMRDGATTEEEKARAENTLKMANLLKEAAPGYRFTVPGPIDGDGMTFEGSDRRVEILSYGLGHTESDLFAHIPDADLVVTGDLLWVGHHPRVNDGDPAAWARVLDQIDGLGPKSLIPGHGVIGGRADAEYLAGYLRILEAMVDEAITDGLTDDVLGSIPMPAGSEDWAGDARFHGSISSLVTDRRG